MCVLCTPLCGPRMYRLAQCITPLLDTYRPEGARCGAGAVASDGLATPNARWQAGRERAGSGQAGVIGETRPPLFVRAAGRRRVARISEPALALLHCPFPVSQHRHHVRPRPRLLAAATARHARTPPPRRRPAPAPGPELRRRPVPRPQHDGARRLGPLALVQDPAQEGRRRRRARHAVLQDPHGASRPPQRWRPRCRARPRSGLAAGPLRGSDSPPDRRDRRAHAS